MGTAEKLVDRILRSKNVPNDVKPRELIVLAKYLGWGIEEGKGSHVKFLIPSIDGTTKKYPVPLGHPGDVNPRYIKGIRKIVLGDEQKEADA